MHAVSRFIISVVLIAFTLLPGLNASDPVLRDASLSVPLLISKCQEADTPAMIAKVIVWSFPSPPVFVRLEDPDSSEHEAEETPPPQAVLEPGLLLTSLRWSSET